uniref:Sushi domain containing 5 n=1 Tax=Pelusios castaneus TaxID=367368 RepID=A0A8C8VHE2_9SAUR
TLESRNSSQGLDLTAAQKLCADLGARLATTEELTRAVVDCSFAVCTKGWLADGTIGTMVCSKTGSNQQSVKAVINIENDPSPSGRYNAFCVKDEDKPCGDPPSFPHTILHGHTGFEMGDELLYVCAQGYVMGNKETAFTLLCDSCGEWYGQVQACVKDDTEAHIDYEDNFPVAEHEENHGEEAGEKEQEQRFSHSKGTEAERVRSSKDVTQEMDSAEKGSKAPTESPVSLLSQKHLFWFAAESFNEPESDKEPDEATKTQFSDGNNHIGVKTIYNEPGTKMIYNSEDFPIGPVLVKNDTKAMRETVTNIDESWLDGYPVTQEAAEYNKEEEDKIDGSMGTEDDIVLTTDQPNHVEVRKEDKRNPFSDKDLTQIVAAPTRMHDYDIKNIPLVLTPTSAPENVSASKGSNDVNGYHPTTSLGFVTQESATPSIQHDLPILKIATLKTFTTVSPFDHIPYPEAEETTTYPTQETTTTSTREVFTDSLSKELIEQENLTYGTGENLPTDKACVREDCASPSKGPMTAITVTVLCLLLLASILAVWCFKKRQQKSSVYKLNGKGQTRHPHHHQQIEMQKI